MYHDKYNYMYLHFQRKSLMNLYISATVHSLKNGINLIYSCQADLPMQYASNRSDTGVVIDSEPHMSRTCKTNLLFASSADRVHTGCSAFPFYTPTKPFIQLHIKYKTVLFPIL